MPTVTFRIPERELQELRQEARARGISASALIRQRLEAEAKGVDLGVNLDAVVEDHERRLSRLEGMAGL